MDEPSNRNHWAPLDKDDAALKQEIEELLTKHALRDPYSTDGKFAASIFNKSPN